MVLPSSGDEFFEFSFLFSLSLELVLGLVLVNYECGTRVSLSFYWNWEKERGTSSPLVLVLSPSLPSSNLTLCCCCSLHQNATEGEPIPAIVPSSAWEGEKNRAERRGRGGGRGEASERFWTLSNGGSRKATSLFSFFLLPLLSLAPRVSYKRSCALSLSLDA